MTGIEVEGFDELEDRFRELQEKAKDLDGEHEVALPDLLPPKFMQRYTEFESIEAMLEASDWSVESQEDFWAIPDDEWDHFVAEHTRFETWQKMITEAAGEHFGKRLGLR